MYKKFKAASFQSSLFQQKFWQHSEACINLCFAQRQNGRYPRHPRPSKFWWYVVGVLWFLLAGCGSITVPTPLDALPPTEGRDQQWAAIFQEHTRAEEAVATLILAERQATIDQNLDLLGQLWAENARIVDGRGSSTTTDDYVWQGRPAILDRYQVAVFPFDLPLLTQLAPETAITITGDEATVQHGGDQWQLVKTNKRWWLMTLHYQMAPVVN